MVQEALTDGEPDETLICAVFYIMLTEMAFGEFQKTHNHLKGMSLMYLAYMKKPGAEASLLMQYMAESAAYLDTLPGLLGYPLSIADEILPEDTDWFKHLMTTPESERWIRMDLKHVRFQRRVVDAYNDKDEIEILQEGLELIEEIHAWQEKNIPPYFEETRLFESDQDEDINNTRRFLNYTRLKFESPLHCEIHLLFCQLILIITFVIDPSPGSTSQLRVDAAVKYCQCLAALGPSPSSGAPATRTFGQFYARLTFDDAFPEGVIPSDGSDQ
jgi:hypothetical protein